MSQLVNRELIEELCAPLNGEQRETLAIKFDNGTQDFRVTIEEQFLGIYGGKFTRFNRDRTRIQFWTQLKSLEWMIDDIKGLQDRIAVIKDPRTYADEVTTSTGVSERREDNTTSTTQDKGESQMHTASISEGSVEANTKTIDRGASSQDNQIQANYEDYIKGEQIKLQGASKQREISLQGGELKITTQEQEEEAITATTGIEKPPIKWNTFSLNSSAAKDVTKQDGSAHSISTNVTTSQNALTTHTGGTSESSTITKQVTNSVAESELKALKQEIPSLRARFLSKFSFLFSESQTFL